MIKIILSGTYDGYYPRYASDGVLDDDITRRLLDRNMLFSRDENHLFREGYSFQVVQDRGILFHKTIQLFDAAGRDGFMMASIFLPVGDMLDGKEIKEALDAIIKEYKLHTVGGIANVELDWSFVKRKADELNEKVRQMIWKKHPMSSDSSRTALIRGADNRVAEYFQYPNPLHPGCAGYGLVFLTESLLDSSMVSDNGEQGYKVLTTDIVDIDNPVYAIIYINPNEYSTSGLKKNVERKELMATVGGYFCGSINQNGYRPKDVYIPADKKTSLDGMTLEVELPTLVPKHASVLLIVKDPKTETEISLEGCTVNWKSDQYYDTQGASRMHTGSCFSFEKEECDRKWNVKVACDLYEEGETQVDINDGDINKPVKVTLRYNPEWTIVVSSPETYLNVPEMVRQDRKESAKELKIAELRKKGLDVRPVENDKNRVVTLLADYSEWTIKILMPSNNLGEYKVRSNELEKKIEGLKKDYESKGLIWKKREDSEETKTVNLLFDKQTVVTHSESSNPRRENVFKDPSKNGNIAKPESPEEPKKKKWVLQLDVNGKNSSKDFSLFKNYKRRRVLEETAKNDLNNLDVCINAFVNGTKNNYRGENKVVKDIEGQMTIIKGELAKGTKDGVNHAEKAYNAACKMADKGGMKKNDAVSSLIKCAKKAIASTKKYVRIPKVVKRPKEVDYDSIYHRLVVEAKEKPENNYIPEFEKDKHEYSFEDTTLSWADVNDNSSHKKHKVVQKLRRVYKFLWFVLPLLVIGVAIALYYSGDNTSKLLKSKKSLIVDAKVDLQSNYQDHYCDDELYDEYTKLLYEYDSLVGCLANKEDQSAVKEDTAYCAFVNSLANQKNLKTKDSVNYSKLEFLKEDYNDWKSDKNKKDIWNELFEEDSDMYFAKMIAPMSKAHKAELKECFENRLTEVLEAEQKEFDEIVQKEFENLSKPCIMSKDCGAFIAKYGKSIYKGRYQDKVDSANTIMRKLTNEENEEQSDYDSWYNTEDLEKLNLYLNKYQNDCRFSTHVANVKKKINSMKPKPDPQNPVEKTPITNPDDLFDKLNPENVYAGLDYFNNKYEINKESLKKSRDYVFKLVNNSNKPIPRTTYTTIYTKIKNNNKLTEKGAKLTELGKQLAK